jgi:hypothetical protein
MTEKSYYYYYNYLLGFYIYVGKRFIILTSTIQASIHEYINATFIQLSIGSRLIHMTQKAV